MPCCYVLMLLRDGFVYVAPHLQKKIVRCSGDVQMPGSWKTEDLIREPDVEPLFQEDCGALRRM